MKKILILLLPAFLFSVMATIGQPPSKADLFSPIETTILDLIEAGSIPSMAVAVAQKGEILWMDAFGWANKEQRIAANPQTIYALGSLSKSMAATGMMTLIESGKVRMDQSVNSLIEPARLHSYVDEADAVKVKHILNMSAGIPHGWASYPDSLFSPLTESQKDLFTNRIGKVVFSPGEIIQYSNYGYWFLDRMMEKTSSKELDVFMQEAVFAPLNMRNSFTHFQQHRAKDFAVPYRDSTALSFNHFLPYGGGGYYASAEDLIHYGLFYLQTPVSGQEPILSSAAIDLMHNYDPGPEGLFKLGWFNPGNVVISNGNIRGANAMILLVPEEEIAIVCLTNTHVNSYADQMAFRILDHMIPGFDRGMNPEKYIRLYQPPYEDQVALRGKWEGTIEVQGSTIPVRMRFTEDSEVFIQMHETAEQSLQSPSYNFQRKLKGRFTGHLPFPEKQDQEPGPCNLVLIHEEGQLSGYIQSSFSRPDGSSFAFGAYTRLKKE